MSEEQTVKCPICGEPYKVYMFYAGDQSAFPDCVRKAADKIKREPFERLYLNEPYTRKD